ncbi:hypothetical protein VS877_22705, partial [Salmonella enterica subsp. enterica serovar Paratyphi A]|nr:hypothetical protein [Salmonella enterica subsp. enterica serovar Paratyphi A]
PATNPALVGRRRQSSHPRRGKRSPIENHLQLNDEPATNPALVGRRRQSSHPRRGKRSPIENHLQLN